MPVNSTHYLFLSLLLFSIGIMGALMRRNAIIIFMCIELMLNAVNLLLVAFSKIYGDADAQLFVFFIMKKNLFQMLKERFGCMFIRRKLG